MGNRSSARSGAKLDGSSSAAVLGALCVLACGTADQVYVPEMRDAGSQETLIASAVNVCPYFDGSLITPQQISPGVAAFIDVHATDPDAPNAQLVLAWIATSGTFSHDDESMTSYTCSALGSQKLTVSARDQQGCVGALTLDVECLAK